MREMHRGNAGGEWRHTAGECDGYTGHATGKYDGCSGILTTGKNTSDARGDAKRSHPGRTLGYAAGDSTRSSFKRIHLNIDR